ncbi:MAG: glycoside hydrolase family 3 C-terminal domain-containing protein [Bacteroidota bacterium]|nr:glycoside hydrolase family 3 C-terminal domain-containing protein [Bacteroidota bacterium]
MKRKFIFHQPYNPNLLKTKFIKVFILVVVLFYALFTIPLRADESAPSPCDKSFTVAGAITHFKMPAALKVDQKAIEAAKSADVIIYVGGLNAGLEGEESSLVCPGFNHGDRTRIELPYVQERILRTLHNIGKPVIFVNCTGSALAMPWEAANLDAILQAWYPGGEGGTAVTDVLFENYNPAGRLPVTFYEKTSDLPDFNDYRMFKGKVLFPFGYGLSYTTFQYQTVRLKSTKFKLNGEIQLTFPIKNTGSRNGDEVVQIYVRHMNSPVPQPIRSLVAFKRIHVDKGATVMAKFKIPVERFRYWGVEKKEYVVDYGKYEIQIGASSNDIRQFYQVSVVKL